MSAQMKKSRRAQACSLLTLLLAISITGCETDNPAGTSSSATSSSSSGEGGKGTGGMGAGGMGAGGMGAGGMGAGGMGAGGMGTGGMGTGGMGTGGMGTGGMGTGGMGAGGMGAGGMGAGGMGAGGMGAGGMGTGGMGTGGMGTGGMMCSPTNGGVENCDGVDNDCNGAIDDGPNIDWTNPATCGTCANNCLVLFVNTDIATIGCLPSANPGVDPGTCTCGTCLSGFHDLDGDCSCEYACITTAPDDTLCNGIDDDCNGLVDEDVDPCTDVMNCGACGYVCNTPNATPTCTSTAAPGEACTFSNTQCEIATCNAGFFDADGSSATGCEYACTLTNGGVERCGDGIDNDCDGKIDGADDLSNDPQIGMPCFGDPDGECATPAHAGVTTCVGTTVRCTGPNVLTESQLPEICNGKDDNCNGQVDDGPTDVGGTCGQSNTPPCQLGTQQCINGALTCIGAILPQPELCDGQDNNCNGITDDSPTDVGGPCGTDVGACQPGVLQCLVGGVKSCVGPIGPTLETCNGQDDDCDGAVDDVAGAGTPCGQSNTPPCAFGVLQCAGPNLVCVGAINPTVETCNTQDDDCDGQIDEGVPDELCVPAGTDPTLVYGGTSRCRKGTQACGGACVGFVGPTAETCNSLDDDCDGAVDDNLPLEPCNVPPPPPPGGTSPCQAGTYQCAAGVLSCQGSVGPMSALDTCGVDANCDGVLTGQPNFQNDPANCGSCSNNCNATAVHAVWGCQAGMCVFQGCEAGYYDLNGDQTCEYACIFTSAQESCNGVDDDCDGQVDENIAFVPSPSQVCGTGVGATRPECTTGITIACTAGAWQCAFPAGVCVGGCSADDETCDMLDNDCDGALNENAANFGLPCASDDFFPGSHGPCRTLGNYICNGPNATICSAVKADCATLPGGCTEFCDGVDNDCDGLTDEPFTNRGSNVVNFVKPPVTKLGAQNKWIFTYEASRFNATTITPGTGNGYWTSAPTGATLDKTVACSAANKIPWFNVTPREVEQVCQAAGGTICLQDDWRAAIRYPIPDVCLYGYAPLSQCQLSATATAYCNLAPFDFSPAPGDQDGLLVTASPLLANCWADWTGQTNSRLYDMTGNLLEITKTAVAATTYPLLGGSYFQTELAARADNGSNVVDNAYLAPDVGFRCCFTSNPSP